MDAETLKALADLVAQDETVFGDVTGSNQIKAETSVSLAKSAENLLAKAARSIADGDEPRAVGYVERAVLLPFDEHEQIRPEWWAAHMLVFDTVVDALQASEPTDTAWLVAVEDVLDGLTGYGQVTLVDTLAAIVCDYDLPQQEIRRIKGIIQDAGSPEWLDKAPADGPERVQAILAAVRVAVACQRAPSQSTGSLPA
jgi:hypothetical protein